jgi:hypothetical protein
MDNVSALKDWLTAREASKIIGRSYTQITRYCDQGRLAHIRVGPTILIRKDVAETFQPPPRGNPQFLLQSSRARSAASQTG